ncbi:3288_t:CDS:2, partial [Gigaspora rosea]
ITEKHSSNNKRDAPGEQEVIRYRKLVARIFGLEKTVKKLERDVASLETELEDLDDCVDKSTVVDLIHKIVTSLINEKGKSSSYSSDSSEKSDSVEIIEVREQKAVPHKQQRKTWPRKIKIKKAVSSLKEWEKNRYTRYMLTKYGLNNINNLKTPEAWLQFAKYHPPEYIRRRLLILGYDINRKVHWRNFVFRIKNHLTRNESIANNSEFREFKTKRAVRKRLYRPGGTLMKRAQDRYYQNANKLENCQ